MDRDTHYYKNEMSSIKELKLQPIDSITLVSLAALLADYHNHLSLYPECTLDQFYDYKKTKLVNQKSDIDAWTEIIENDPNYQTMMSDKVENK